MELWAQNFKKSEENLISSRLLFDEGFIGLSAFHAQQCVELAVKAVALKHGFERYLRKKPKFKHSHIPARGLTSEIYDFVIESLEQVDRKQFDEKMSDAITESLSNVRAIKNFFKEIEEKKDGEKFEKVWMYSLGIETSDEIITALDAYKKTCDDKLSKQLCLGASELSRKVVLDLKKFAIKSRQELKFRTAVKTVKEIIPDYGLPEDIVDVFIEGKDKFEKMISNIVDKHGVVGIMDFLLGPKGFLNIFTDSRFPPKILEKWNIEKRINFIWMTYLVTISPTTVLLFPHVIIGRYPRVLINGKNTEDVYLENSSRVNELIKESDRTFKRIKQILEM